MSEIVERILSERQHARMPSDDAILRSLNAAILVEDIFGLVLSDEQLVALDSDDEIRALHIAPPRGD